MAKLAGRYPDDKEASILSALITSANFDPADKTYANQLKAAKILEPLFVAQPDHPGVAHYLIHSYDYPPIAKQGLGGGQALRQDRPGCAARAAHALAHLHARRPLAGLDRGQPRVGQGSRAMPPSMRIMPSTTWSTRICSSRRTRPRARPWTNRVAEAVDHFGAAFAYAAMPARLALEARTGRLRQASRSSPRPMPTPGASTRRPRPSTPSHGASAQRAAATPPRKTEHARLLALRDVAKERKLATGRSRSTSRPRWCRGSHC